MEHWLKMSGALRVEATSALPWLSAAVPLATFTGVLTGTLEGQRRFGVVNAIQACGTVLFQGAPLIAAYTTGPQLQVIIPAAVIARAISIIPFGIAVKSSLPVTSMPRIKMSLMRDLLSYGGWVSVTNLISPVLESFDRVLIGVILGAADIAYYAVPFSLVGRTRIFPFALSRTLFPYLSAEASDQASTRALGAISTLAAAAIPVTIIGMLLMRPFLEFWMGIGFAAHASLIGETLLCAIWINGVASIPFALLQAQGRPDVVAKFHLAEILPYIGLLWICLLRFGLLGAAIAWAVRAIIDAVLLIFATSFGRAAFSRLLPGAVLIAITWIPLYELPLLAGSLKVILECSIVVLALTWSAYTSPELRIYLRRAWDQVKLC
jgi:O-antigen/teichoic acid export membrane protein